MTRHFELEIEKLKRKTLGLGNLVEELVHKAVKSVIERDTALANTILEADDEVDQIEVEIEEECLKILALHQPVAQDLRFVVAVLKLNSDLERIGDLAVAMAWRAISLSKLPRSEHKLDLNGMAAKVKAMVRKSLQALVNLDSKLAVEVCSSDDEIDAAYRAMYKDVRENIKRDPECIESMLILLLVARNLERIADHATNIAEDVLYLINGEIVRHRRDMAVVPPDVAKH